jgi:hypothetical protein
MLRGIFMPGGVTRAGELLPRRVQESNGDAGLETFMEQGAFNQTRLTGKVLRLGGARGAPRRLMKAAGFLAERWRPFKGRGDG